MAMRGPPEFSQAIVQRASFSGAAARQDGDFGAFVVVLGSRLGSEAADHDTAAAIARYCEILSAARQFEDAPAAIVKNRRRRTPPCGGSHRLFGNIACRERNDFAHWTSSLRHVKQCGVRIDPIRALCNPSSCLTVRPPACPTGVMLEGSNFTARDCLGMVAGIDIGQRQAIVEKCHLDFAVL